MPEFSLKDKPMRADEDPDLLTTLVNYFEDSEEQSRAARERSERDRDYADHKQLTNEEIQTLKKRKQPPVINNYIRKKVNFLRGYERQIRTDPKAQPRTPQHEEDATAATDALRYIADNDNFDVRRSEFWDNYIIEGTGACEVIVSKDDKRQVETPNIQWDRLFWDYHSRKLDFSDALYTGIVIWDDADNVMRNFPDSEDVIQSSFAQTSVQDETYEDKPNDWVDTARNRVRVVQIYFLYRGIWHLAFYTKAGFLVKPQLSPWLDEDDLPENGMIMQSAYVDREGNRYGEPRFMIEMQDSINKRESKAVHLINQRQTAGNKRAFPDGVRKQKRELAKPDGHIEMSGNAEFGKDFLILPTGDMAQGQMALLQEAKQDMIKNSGAEFATAQAAGGQSGRAVLAQQNGAMIEINPLADGKKQWEQRVYRAWWNRVRQFWTSERWIRVTDDESNVRFVGLNKPVSVAESVQEELGEIPQGFENDPRMSIISRVDNQVSQMDVDIIIEDSPDVANIQQEEFRNLVDLANVGITFDQEIYIKASQLRNKQEILDSMKGKDEAQQAAIAQQQQVEQQLTTEAVSAAIEKDASSAFNQQMQALNEQAEAQKTQAETRNKEADTEQILIENQQMQAGLR